MTTEQKKLWDIVDKILWEDWDPIGVNDAAPRDEYQPYVPTIFRMLLEKSTSEEISTELFNIETHKIGLSGDKKHFAMIAERLLVSATNFVTQS